MANKLSNCTSFQNSRNRIVSQNDLDSVSLLYTEDFMQMMEYEVDKMHRYVYPGGYWTKELADNVTYFAGAVLNLYRITMAQTYNNSDEPKFLLPKFITSSGARQDVFRVQMIPPLGFYPGRSERMLWDFRNLVSQETSYLFPRITTGYRKTVSRFKEEIAFKSFNRIIDYAARALLMYYSLKPSLFKYDARLAENKVPTRVAKNLKTKLADYHKDKGELLNLYAKCMVADCAMSKVDTDYIVSLHAKDTGLPKDQVQDFYGDYNFADMYAAMLRALGYPDLKEVHNIENKHYTEFQTLKQSSAENRDVMFFFSRYDSFVRFKKDLKHINLTTTPEHQLYAIKQRLQAELEVCESARKAIPNVALDKDNKFLIDECHTFLTQKLQATIDAENSPF